MTTQAQIGANKKNAHRSTGPKTSAGKAASSRNSLRHGLTAKTVILPGEDPQTYLDHQDAIHRALHPIGAVEELVVDRIIGYAWRLRRVEHVEASLFRYQGFDQAAASARRQAADLEIKTGFDITQEMMTALAITIKDPKQHAIALRHAEEADAARDQETLATAFIRDATSTNALSKLSRYEVAMERGLYRGLHELHSLQAVRKGHAKTEPPVIDVDPSTPGD